MRIVLLGNRVAGRSTSGNTILGRKVFDNSQRTAECAKRDGATAGRCITVVEAPGWWCDSTVALTPERDKREILLSVSLCPPGPHALLLVIDARIPFTEKHKRSMQQHMELLGERVWKHSIVLFNRGDSFGDTNIEQHIESEGKSLQWVVEKCGNRYHVLNNKKRDADQVAELLEKIEEMVSGNRGHHFDFDAKMMEEVMMNKEEEGRRAEERKMKVQTQRETLRSSSGDLPQLSDFKIVLLGNRTAGKSSSGNTILGQSKFDTSGGTAECVKRVGEIAGRSITVVKAPGWWFHSTVDQTPYRDKQEIVLSVSLCPPGPHALLLVINLSHTFRETNRRAVQQHMELLGESVWSHTIVLFTRGNWLGDTTIEQHIESGGENLQWVVEKCGNRYHVVENRKSDIGQVTELLQKIEEMVAGNRNSRNICMKLQEKNKEEERRAEERKRKVHKQRQITSAGGVPHISDMKVVLLGNINAGKSSSGNTILGRDEFSTSGRTAECVKREGATAGRHITLVEAPGWWKNYTVEQTPERAKREIVLSVSLCPPGPHALLLVIDVSFVFTETHKRVVQEHMELLGERVWSHTIVLFITVDWPKNATIEKHLESEREALQWIVEKCGNRYHVFNNTNRDGGQVAELLEKVEEMVAGNKGQGFDFDLNLTQQLMEKKKEEDRRAEERKMKVHKQRQTLRSSADIVCISDMSIVLVGSRYAGKSSSGNTILGRKEFSTSRRTAECVKREGATAGRHITVVEAPGWCSNLTEQTPKREKQAIALSVSLCPPGPRALLLLINVSKSFTETQRRAVQEHMELLSERVWSHTIVLFTRGDWLGDTSIEQHIESGGEALQWVVEKCGNRYHVLNNKKSDGGQVTELLEKIEEMVVRNRGEWSMEEPINFSEGFPDDLSMGDSAHAKPTPESQAYKQLSTAASTQSSGFGSAETGERSGSAEKWQAFQVKTPFVDETTIRVNYTACIGQGAYGKVYRGSYQGTAAAVKILAVGDNPVKTNEFMVALHLSHPNIVWMMAVATSETQILIANEYIHGANLQQVVYTDTPIQLQPEDKLFVALEIAMAVEYIHGKQIIHQDLKPANIMIAAKNRQAYLTDWGLANLKETLTSSQTGAHCGPIGGTPPYMAPECLVECKKCSTMSDMWSLGITLLEMFTNSKPWTNSDKQEIRELLYNRKPPLALPELPPALDDIVRPLIEYEPKSRTHAKDLVILLKSKVDLTKRYGYTW
ncbi:uncharacterized protein LOC134074663 [Sardina pilchardus]|uniref:uncharacterized protein LOC134074663 n=1 Tax=Sardina pilchardus TaxID=27697 RepID=UPI002E12E8FE